jgi:histidinol dehydrogenase
MASAIMITTSLKLAKKVSQEVERQLAKLERRSIAREALGRRGGMVVVTSQDEAIRLANEYAPEHLCLMLRDSWSYLGRITNAGGIFLGEASSEALGDYIAGPSHVMPTGGTARFSSPLGIHDFIKVTSLVALDGKASQTLGAAAATIARAEGLTGHARALEARKSPPVEGLEEEGRWG